MGHQYFVYILTNDRHTVVYTGVTNDLVGRVSEHRKHGLSGFTRRYNVDKLVFYEETNDVRAAIAREKADQGRFPAREGRADRKHEPRLVGFVRKPDLTARDYRVAPLLAMTA
jgi:predicted GIY-YIG superfamily endonuclease